MSYIGRTGKLSQRAYTKVDFLATAGQTIKTGLSYVAGFVEVHINGLLLTDAVDYTATNGNSVTFVVALNVNDEVTVVSLKTFAVPDTYTKAEADGSFATKANFTSTGIDDNATSTAVTVDSSGNVLVGKTSISTATTGHMMLNSGLLASTRSGAEVAVLNRNSSDGDIALFRKDGSTVGSIGSYSGDNLTIGTSDTGIRFDSGLNTLVPHNVSTNSNQDATIILGHPSVRYKDLYLSGGVYLGGTGAANKLDDYESGTWTPTLSQGNSWATSASFSYSTYVKIGSLVTVFTNMLTSGGSGNASAADALQVLGLPFTSSAVDAAAGTFWTSSNYNAGGRNTGHLMVIGVKVYAGMEYAASARNGTYRLAVTYQTDA